MKTWLCLLGLSLTACIGVDEIFDEIPTEDLSRLEVAPDNLALMVNESATLAATYFDASGMEANAVFSWVSTQPQIATVNDDGVVSALQPGSCRITVTSDKNPALMAETMVNVVSNPNQVGTIDIVAPATTVAVDGMIQLSAVAKNAAGTEVDGITFTWKSNDEALLEITQNGKITGKANGTTTVTASADGISSPALKIMVGATNTRTGTFKGLGGYSAKGTAELAAGTLSFSSDFASDNGPGLFIYLTKSASSISGSVELGAIASNKGAQTYAVPSTVGLNDYDFVLIYCKPFGVPFGVAELQK